MNDQAIAVATEQPLARKSPIGDGSSAFAVTTFEAAWQMARIAVASGFTTCKTPEAAFFVMGVGEELGLSSLQSLRGIHNIEGKPSLAADTMLALAFKSGKLSVWKVIEHTSTAFRVIAGRGGTAAQEEFSWTIEDAQQAGLTGKANWKNYSKSMLRARGTAAALRAVLPDVLMGIYCPEELGIDDVVNEREPESREPSVPAPAPKPRTARKEAEPKAPPPTADGEIVDEDIVEVAAPPPPPVRKAEPVVAPPPESSTITEESAAAIDAAFAKATTIDQTSKTCQALINAGHPRDVASRAYLARCRQIRGSK